MRKSPVFVGTAILTLAIAIGGNTAMFTVIRAVLLNPLKYRSSDRLVLLQGGATPTRFAEMNSAARSFAGLGAFTRGENFTLSGGGEPEVVRGVRVSAGFLQILGVQPLLGRGFRPSEDAPGATPAAMISSELWQRRFSSDTKIAGKAATIDTLPCTIVGVLPPHFQFPSAGIDVWMTAPTESPALPAGSRTLSPFLTLFGRLRSGVNVEEANAEMRVVRHQYAAAHPAMLDAKPKSPVEVISMKESLVSDVRSMLWMLFGALGFVLLIACANLANLLLTRAAGREREFALRSALGASGSRLVSQLLSESVLLSVAGGVAGLLPAALCLRLISRMTSIDLPRQAEIQMDWTVLGFATLLSFTTGLAFGLAPALGIFKPDLAGMLRASGEGARRRMPVKILSVFKLRSLLSAGQVALSIVLLIGAALLMKSVASLRAVPVGFDASHLLTVSVSLPPLRYDTDEKVAAFFAEACQRLGSLPGVRGAAAGMALPMMDYPGIPVQDASKPRRPLNERLIAKFFPVTPGYFQTLGIPLKRGREFTSRDGHETQPVAIIDEHLARRLWPAYPAGLNPIGQRLWVGGLNPKPAEIVGVVADVHQNLDSSADWPESVYVAFAQNPSALATLAVRTSGAPLGFVKAVREQIREVDGNQPIGFAQTMEDRMEAQVGKRQLLENLLGALALTTLLLAIVGLYGVMAYSVTQRVQEIGIRQALGARRSDILGLVVGEGAVMALVGILAGLGGATVLTRVMKHLLFQVSATDPVTFVGAGLVFFVIALVACYVPARRASRVDPMAALRG